MKKIYIKIKNTTLLEQFNCICNFVLEVSNLPLFLRLFY
jgi:hypothetical protein